MKRILKVVNRIGNIGGILCLGALIATLAFGQAAGYRFFTNGMVVAGPGAGLYFEPTFNAGSDVALARIQAGQAGMIQGSFNSITSPGFLNLPPVIALATATSGGTIANGTYRAALVIYTPTGGSTNITATQEATQTTTGTGASTITATAPIAEAGAAGYVVAVSPAGGATLTETMQPMSTAVCAGAFAVTNPNGGAQTTVCPFGVNAVLTSLVTGPAIPSQNTAVFPAAVPELICNLLPQTTNVTITTIQAMGTCPLGPGTQNYLGKVIEVTGHGVYTSGAQTGTMTISLTEGGITPMTVTSGAIVTGGQTNAQFSFDYFLTTSALGAAGTLEGHGQLCVNLATANNSATLSCFNDQITAASSAINLTAQNNLVVNITMTTSTTSATLRDAQVWLRN